MTILFFHIRFLLRHHDCVIVPGFGAFIATSTPAQIDMEKGKIIPPSRVVTFNQALKDDDGLLVNSLARKNGLTFDEARMVLVRQVAELRGKLETGEHVCCASLGVISLQEEGRILFTPETTDSTLSLGFLPVEFPTASDCTLGEEVIVEQNNRSHNYSMMVKVAVMLLLLVSLAVGLMLYPIPQDNREHRASVVPVEALLKQSDKSTDENDIKKPENDVKDDSGTSQALITAEPRHYLIVGTFSTDREADRYVKMRSSEQFPMTAVKSSKVTRVAVAASDDRQELRMKLNSKEIKNHFPNAWIWSRP